MYHSCGENSKNVMLPVGSNKSPLFIEKVEVYIYSKRTHLLK